jgi:hypothetical protein
MFLAQAVFPAAALKACAAAPGVARLRAQQCSTISASGS